MMVFISNYYLVSDRDSEKQKDKWRVGRVHNVRIEYKNPVISRMLSSHIRKRKTLFITMNARTKTGTKESNLPSISIARSSWGNWHLRGFILLLRSLRSYFFTSFLCCFFALCFTSFLHLGFVFTCRVYLSLHLCL